jgi:hypothetical protein
MGEPELDFSRADILADSGNYQYNAIQTDGLDQANLALAGVPSTAPATTAATTCTTTAMITPTCPASESAGADFAGWADCIDLQDPDGGLLPSDVTETTFMDHFDRGDASPVSTATRFKLTDLMRADLCDSPMLILSIPRFSIEAC